MELKKPTTYEEQVKLLMNKGVSVRDSSVCESFLSRVNYYYFSGFLLPFLDRSIDKCRVPVSFDDLVGLYEFDVELRNLIAVTVERIEMFIRNKLSYYHAHKYGAEGYLSESAFGDKHKHERFLEIVHKCIDDHKNTAIVKHHRDKYDNHFPIWVITEFLSLGSLSYFYGDMKNEDKKLISMSSYGVNYQVMESWLRCITDLRNKCAHCSRLYFWVFSAMPRMPRGSTYKANRRLFSQLMVLKYMYPVRNKWNHDFVERFDELLNKYSDVVVYEHLGLPDDWISLLKNP